MPLLLLLPLLLIVLLLAWVLLLPVVLWQRYRRGTARRRAVPWVVRTNGVLLAISAAMLLASAWAAGYWVEGALRHAATGLAAGVLAGLLGFVLTRFETGPRGLLYTPNRWMVLALTVVVAGRLAWSFVRGWQLWHADAAGWLAQQGGVWAIGGLVLGYYVAFNAGLARRLRRSGRPRP